MKNIFHVFVLAFSFLLFDLRNTRRSDGFTHAESSLIHDSTRRKRREKKQYQNKKWKKKKSYREKSFAYRSTKARDHRFSNQRTLRRMYRNC